MKKLTSLLLAIILVFSTLPLADASKMAGNAVGYTSMRADETRFLHDERPLEDLQEEEFAEDKVIVKLRTQASSFSAFDIQEDKENDEHFSFFSDLGINVTKAETLVTLPGNDSDISIFNAANSRTEDLVLLTLETPGKENVLEMIETLEAIPEVEYAEPDYIMTLTATPNDTSFSYQYGLNKINAPAAWNVTKGSREVVVAVIDTGIDYSHPDLSDNIWTNPYPGKSGYENDVRGWNFVSDNNNIMDTFGHGTHVAGIIGAVGNNNIGITGVSWNVKLMGLKVMNDDNGGNTSNIIKAIDYAEKNGAYISNNSYGSSNYSKAFEDVIKRSKHLFVTSAGNWGINNDFRPTYPANYDCDNIITVASIDENDEICSNYGTESVHIAAPGEGIYSTLPDNEYGFMSGSSAASPHVAGAAALILSNDLSLSVAEMKNRLTKNSDYMPKLANYVSSSGRLNVFKALAPSKDIPGVSVSITSVNSITSIDRLKTLKLLANVSPKDTTQRKVVWSSTDPSVATITADGVVTGVNAGNVTIKASLEENPSITGEFSLSVNEVTGVPEFAGGIGTPESPFEVSTAEELYNVRLYPDRYYIQTKDIDMGPSTMSGGKYYNDGKGWTPIGGDNARDVFAGSYDGGGHSIENLYIDGKNSEGRNIGLFAVNYGFIQNVHIKGGVIKNGVYTGAIAAWNNGDIKNCSSSAHVLSEDGAEAYAIGGIVGLNGAPSNSLVNCRNLGKVECTSTNSNGNSPTETRIGGVVGSNYSTIVEGCSNTGEVIAKGKIEGKLFAGGVIGYSGGYANKDIFVKNCYNVGSVTVECPTDNSNYSYSNIGGVIGRIENSGFGMNTNQRTLEASNCYNTGKIKVRHQNSFTGGVFGEVAFSVVTDCFNTGKIELKEEQATVAGGIMASLICSEMRNTYNVGKIINSNSSSIIGQIYGEDDSVEMNAAETYLSFYHKDNKFTGSGSVEDASGSMEGKTISQLKQQPTFTGWDFGSVWKIDANLNKGYPYLKDIPPVDLPKKTIDQIFSDVKTDEWYYNAVDYVYESGLFEGVSETKFAPNDKMTRAMFVTVMGRLAEQMEEETIGYTNSFADVEENQWYTDYVNWASAKGIVTGYNETTFGTFDYVSRQDMAVLLIRFADYMKIKLPMGDGIEFTDKDDISSYANEAVIKAAQGGIINGSNGMFRPQGTSTRAEVAQVFLNLANKEQ